MMSLSKSAKIIQSVNILAFCHYKPDNARSQSVSLLVAYPDAQFFLIQCIIRMSSKEQYLCDEAMTGSPYNRVINSKMFISFFRL